MVKVEDLTLEEKVGQIMVLGWRGETNDESGTVNAHARACVEEMMCGGLVFMGRNMKTPEQSLRLAGELQDLAKIPLFITTDQEGGLVNRMVNPLTPFPGNMALGATRSEELAYEQAVTVAQELKAVGVNWNFSPVVDVNNNPANPVIGTRSFGEDPELAARLGAAIVRGYQDNGVLACAKHFPGHGDTSVDSHLDLPVVDFERDRLDRVELLPFKRLAEAGVGAMMTAHLTVKSLDPEFPATLSRAILTDLLRGEMRYDGLVITDCMEMKAIGLHYGTVPGSVRSFQSGADILLVCHTLETQRAVHQALMDAVRSGEITEERLNQSVARVLKAKEFLFESAFETPNEPWVGFTHRQLEHDIAHAAVTLVRSNGVMPIPTERKVGVVAFHPAGERLFEAVQTLGYNVEFVKVSEVEQTNTLGEYRAAEEMSKARIELNAGEALALTDRVEVVLIATCLQETRNYRPEQYELQIKLINEILRRKPDAIMIGLREPYDLIAYPQARTYLTAYGYRPANIQALADTLAGKNEAVGQLPVTLPLST